MPQPEGTFRTFVGGATGYTGRHVVEEILLRKVITHAHVRPGSGSRDQWVRRFETLGALVDSTRWELEAMTATLQRIQPTHVFSLLGTTRSKAKADKTGGSSYIAVDYNLSVMLLEAALAAGSQPCFIFLSSLGASSTTSNAYLKVRGDVEDMIKASGLPHLIVQPAIITGPDRGESRLLEPASAASANALLFVAGLFGARKMRSRYSSMTGRELAKGIVHIALNHDRGQSNGRTITYEDVRAL